MVHDRFMRKDPLMLAFAEMRKRVALLPPSDSTRALASKVENLAKTAQALRDVSGTFTGSVDATQSLIDAATAYRDARLVVDAGVDAEIAKHRR